MKMARTKENLKKGIPRGVKGAVKAKRGCEQAEKVYLPHITVFELDSVMWSLGDAC